MVFRTPFGTPSGEMFKTFMSGKLSTRTLDACVVKVTAFFVFCLLALFTVWFDVAMKPVGGGWVD